MCGPLDLGFGCSHSSFGGGGGGGGDSNLGLPAFFDVWLDARTRFVGVGLTDGDVLR